MTRFLLSRLARVVVTVSFAFLLVFVAIRLTPGGPAVSMLGQQASPEKVAELNRQFGWDLPIHRQLFRYLADLAKGDMGIAYLSPGKPPVSKVLARKFPATVELAISALLVAIAVGVPLGVLAADQRKRWPDRLAIAFSSLGVSVPIFFLGILLLMISDAAAAIGALPQMPGSGRLDVRINTSGVEWSGFQLIDSLRAGRPDIFFDALRHLALPALTLASVPMAIIARVTRSAVLETLGSDFIRAARAKGASQLRVLLRHALPAAAVPILSLLGLQLATLLAGAVLTETVFAWPGIGRYVMLAATEKDYNALQGAVLMLGVVFVFVNFVADWLVAASDPRIRLEEQ